MENVSSVDLSVFKRREANTVWEKVRGFFAGAIPAVLPGAAFGGGVGAIALLASTFMSGGSLLPYTLPILLSSVIGGGVLSASLGGITTSKQCEETALRLNHDLENLAHKYAAQATGLAENPNKERPGFLQNIIEKGEQGAKNTLSHVEKYMNDKGNELLAPKDNNLPR